MIFRLWQIAVTIGATLHMVASIDMDAPYFVAVPVALLIMSVLASEPVADERAD